MSFRSRTIIVELFSGVMDGL